MRSWSSTSRGARDGSFDAGIQLALERLLVDPEFLFRWSAIRPVCEPGTPYRSATSSWPRGCRSSCGAASPTTSSSSWPNGGRLNDPEVLEQQVRRMLADPRASGAGDNFFSQWLLRGTSRLPAPDSDGVPGVRREPARGVPAETELFFESQLREDRSVLDLLTRRLHVRQRAAGRALRHSRTSTAAISAACS